MRQAEALAQLGTGRKRNGSGSKAVHTEKDADTLALEKLLTDQLGLRVEIAHALNGGELKVRYKTLDQLDALCHRLQGV